MKREREREKAGNIYKGASIMYFFHVELAYVAVRAEFVCPIALELQRGDRATCERKGSAANDHPQNTT